MSDAPKTTPRRNAPRTGSRRAMRKVQTAAEATALEQIPNVGPSIANDFRGIGITTPAALVGEDPYVLYDRLCTTTGVRHDPCVIDVFIAAVRFMEGAPPHPWWHYTPERKARLAGTSPRE